MSLTEQINNDIKEAMKAKDSARLRALRAIKSALLLALTEKGATEVDETKEIQILQKLAKQRQDSIAIFQAQNRLDLSEKEQEELVFIETYLPQPLTESELEDLVRNVIADMGVSGIASMGKVMGVVQAQVAGRADNKLVADKVKSILAS